MAAFESLRALFHSGPSWALTLFRTWFIIALNESSFGIQVGIECWLEAKMLEKQHEQDMERVAKRGQTEASGEAPDRVPWLLQSFFMWLVDFPLSSYAWEYMKEAGKAKGRSIVITGIFLNHCTIIKCIRITIHEIFHHWAHNFSQTGVTTLHIIEPYPGKSWSEKKWIRFLHIINQFQLQTLIDKGNWVSSEQSHVYQEHPSAFCRCFGLFRPIIQTFFCLNQRSRVSIVMSIKVIGSYWELWWLCHFSNALNSLSYSKCPLSFSGPSI